MNIQTIRRQGASASVHIWMRGVREALNASSRGEKLMKLNKPLWEVGLKEGKGEYDFFFMGIFFFPLRRFTRARVN